MWTKSSATKIAAYHVLILSALGAVVAYLTGEGAEETVENIQGVAENAIEAHEEFAMFALISLIYTGIASILGVILTLKKSSFANKISIVILFLALVGFGLVARTGYLGGKIRHTEVGTGTPQPSNPSGDHD
jgi:uncharacterized membrane protein